MADTIKFIHATNGSAEMNVIKLATVFVAIIASQVASAATLPFTHVDDPRGGAVVTSITSDAANQGNIEVGDRVVYATRIKGQVSEVRSSRDLQFFAAESVPALMIFLHVIRKDTGDLEIRVAPLMQ